MTDVGIQHRPIMGGLQIQSGRPNNGNVESISQGTLTALATRNNQKVLVTCEHVMPDSADFSHRW